MKRCLLSIFFLMFTYSITASVDPLLMRIYADPYVKAAAQSPLAGVAGQPDESFGVDGGRDLTSVFGVNTQAQVIRILSNGKSLIAVNDVLNNQVKIGRFDGDGYLDITFGSSGIRTLNYGGVTDLYIDAQGRILVTGSGTSQTWVARLTPAGSLDSANFASDSITPGYFLAESAASFYALAEQQSGRILCAGEVDGYGVVVALRSDGQLDQSFNPTYVFGQRGYFTNYPSTGIFDIAIHPITDEIYCVYTDSDNAVVVSLLKADGSGLNTSFSIAPDDRITNVLDESQIRVGFDKTGKVIVAAVNEDDQYVVRRYLATGEVDTAFNNTGDALIIDNNANAALTHLIITQNNQILLLGYENYYNNNNMFLARIQADGTLDTSFSSNGDLPYELDEASVTRQARYGAIHPNGKVMLVGFENDGSVNDPIIVSIYGDSFVPEHVQSPGATRAGTLDTTFRDGISPDVFVDDIAGLSALHNSIPKIMHIFNDSSYLLLAQEGTSTYITRLTPTLELEPSFNDGDLLAITTGSGSSTVNSLAFDKYQTDIDTDQAFYIVGNNVGASLPWARHYSATGVQDTGFVLEPASDMNRAHAVAQQSFGRVIIAGSAGSYGAISGHTINGSLDEGFASGTKFVVSGTTLVQAMAVDYQDRIVIAYKDSLSKVSVARIDASGLNYDSSFNNYETGRITNVIAEDQIKLAIDQNNNIVVAAVTTSGYKVRRYNNSNGSLDNSFNGTGELLFQFQGSNSSLAITKVSVESDGKILVLGYNSSSGNEAALVARLLPSGYLDTSFNALGVTPGILEIKNNIQDFQYFDQAVHPDRRIVLFGRDAVNGDTLLTRIFGDDDDYVTLLDLEPEAGVDGAADVSLYNTGYTNLTTLVGSSKAKVVRAIDHGKTLVAIDTGSVTKLVALTAESLLDTSFGNGSGISATTCPTGVTDMFIDANGKILLLGTANGASWLRRYDSDGTNDANFGTSGLVATNITAGYAVKMQKNGRILVAGLDGSYGCLIAYTLSGFVDTTFNGTGKILIGSFPLYTLSIDHYDRIYLAYFDTNSQVTVRRYRSNGLGLDYNFGTNGIIANALNSIVSGADQIHIGLDQDRNLLIAGAKSTHILAAKYSSVGLLDQSFGTSGYVSIADSGVTLKDFLVGTRGYTGSESIMALVGYKDITDDVMYIAWLDQDGHLNTTYNPDGVDLGFPGTVQFEANTANAIRQLRSGVILADGRVVVVGYETSSGTVDSPLLMRRYGHRYASQQSQAPIFGLPGTLDPSLDLDGILSSHFTSGSVNQYAQAIWSFDDGYFLIGGYGTTNDDLLHSHFILVRIGSDGVVDDSFGDNGVVISPLYTAGVDEFLYDITIDYMGRIIAVGYSSNGYGLMRRYLPDGTLDTSFGDKKGDPARPTGVASFENAQFFAVGMQLNGRLVTIGSDIDQNLGLVVTYDLEGVLDPTFGQGGIVYVSDAQSLHSMVIDGDDSILISYKNSSSRASIVRIQDNGLPYNLLQSGDLFGLSGTITDVFGAEISDDDKVKIAFDQAGNIIVAASMQGHDTMQMRRYLPSGLVDTSFHTDGSPVIIAIQNGVHLHRLMANEAGQYVTVGYVESGYSYKPFVAQVKNDGYLDTYFNVDGTQPGVNFFVIPGGGVDQKLKGAVIGADGKIVGVGFEQLNDLYHPVMISMFDTPYSDEVQRDPDFVSEGSFDTSFSFDGKATVYAGDTLSPTSNQEVRAVRQLQDLKLMTVIGDGFRSWTVRMDKDGTRDVSYGSGDGVLIVSYDNNAEVVHHMELDHYGNMMIVGTHSTQGGYLKKIIFDGTMDRQFGGNNGDPIGTLYNMMTETFDVAPLSDGSMVVVGNNNGTGTAKMIMSTSALDTTFASSGVYNNGSNIASVVVDSRDNIYLAIGYFDTVQRVRIVKMNRAGVLDTRFGNNGVVNNVISDIDDYKNVRIALDKDGKIVVAASWNGNVGKVGVVRYTPAGIFDDQFNLGNQFDISFSTETSVVLTGLIALRNGQILVSGYQDGGNTITDNDQWFVAQLQNSGIYDDEFNTTGQIPGVLTFQMSSDPQHTRYNHDMTVQRDGRIVLAGGESPAVDQSTPLLARLLNSDDVTLVARNLLGANLLPNLSYPGYGTDSISESAVIEGLLEGGLIAVTTGDNSFVGGLTSDSKLVVAQFEDDGSITTSYGNNGIASSPEIINLINGGSIAVDANGMVLAGAVTSDRTLAAVRFTTAGIPDATFSGDGLAQTSAITNLSNGGYVAAGQNNRVIVGGMTSDHKLVATRFTSIGDADGTFGSSGIAKTGVVDGLIDGGFVIVNDDNEVFVGGCCDNGTLVIAKFGSSGVLDNDFGIGGIIFTDEITDLVGLGSIALDSNSQPIIGGYTNDGSLVAARFTVIGEIDTTFGSDGVVISTPILGLNIGGFITIDGLDRVSIGGFVISELDEKSMVVARFNSVGDADTNFATDGVATTGTIDNLVEGGFIAVDSYDRILFGGMTVDNGQAHLIAVELYSGDEVSFGLGEELSPELIKVLRYGSNPERFRKIILVDYYLSLIEDQTIRNAIQENIDQILSEYISQYATDYQGDRSIFGSDVRSIISPSKQLRPGLDFNLVWNLFKKDLAFIRAKAYLRVNYPLAATIIGRFFDRLEIRKNVLRNELLSL